MKYFITVFLLLIAVSAPAQITLEHTYPSYVISGGFGLVEVDSNVWKYVGTNQTDTIVIYNLDHSLEKVIHIPWIKPDPLAGGQIFVIAKRLFSTDDA